MDLNFERLPLVFAIIILMTTSGFWIITTYQIQEDLIENSEELTSTFASSFETKILDLVELIDKILIPQWLDIENIDDLTSYTRYLEMVPQFFDFSDSYLAINWIDTDGVIRYVYPYERNQAAINQSIIYTLNGEFNTAFNYATAYKTPYSTDAIRFYQGGMGTAIYLPIVFNNQIYGYFNILFDAIILIEQEKKDHVGFQKYDFEILDDGEVVIDYGDIIRDKYFTESEINFFGQEWFIHSRPKQEILNSVSYMHNIYILITGLFATAIIYYLTNIIAQKNKEIEEEYREKEIVKEAIEREQKLDALGSLAGGISHDFNNLLMGVASNVSIIDDFVLPKLKDYDVPDKIIDDLVESVNTIEQTVKRGSDLVKQILGFSRHVEVDLEILDAAEIVEEAMNLVKNLSDRRIQFEYEMRAENTMIFASRTKIFQMLMNVILNSKDAIQGHGTISISINNMEFRLNKYEIESLDSNYDTISFDKKQQLVIKIVDTGIGMDDETLEHAFDIFFTKKSLTSSKGTGLGLAIVQQILTSIKGDIQMSSVPDHGTKCEIYLPLINVDKSSFEKKEPEMDEDKSSTSISSFHQDNVFLIVEDEEPIITALSRYLKNYNMEILTANNGIMGWEQYKNIVDKDIILILDINLPGISGVELYENIKTIKPDQVVLFITGYSDFEVLDLEYDHVQALTKPFNSKQFKEKIDYLLKFISE
ncbi:MAG: response regulator [Candidatus Heimdallarchaeota archaeon]|nr:response regulator [Candidatus Heimdallarchaeota archaeon]